MSWYIRRRVIDGLYNTFQNIPVSAVPAAVAALAQTAAKTSAYTAAVNDLVIVDGTSSSVPITLPTAPANGSRVGVKRFDATYTPANIPTVAVGGSDAFLGGSTTAAQLLLQGQTFIFQYNSGTAQWVITSTDEPLAQTDQRYFPTTIAPTDFGWGGWAFDPSVTTNAGVAPTAGTVYLVALPVRGTQTVTNIILAVGTAGSGLTSGQNFAGLFQNGNLLAATADQSTNWASVGFKVMPLTTPQVVNSANGLVYAAFFGNGTTRAAFTIAPSGNAMWETLVSTSPLKRFAFDSTNTGRTTSFQSTLGTLGLLTSIPYWAAWS